MSQRETPGKLIAYYAARAAEYDDVYHKPERQDDIGSLRSILRELLRGHSVLEVACGTGFWTEEIAATASHIHATDTNESVLEIASKRLRHHRNVTIDRDDAFALTGTTGVFTAAFAGFWWSHVPKGEQLCRFLNALHAKLQPGALVVFTDNRYVEGSNLPITREDADGNTYQKRRLREGTEYEVLKNFPEEAELRSLLQGRGSMIDFRWLTYYWCLSYQTCGTAEPNI
jgi:2-polyprenyl-3-methyl-5-hydroxy-6-metoxy-1,4-benzoquinol methylase